MHSVSQGGAHCVRLAWKSSQGLLHLLPVVVPHCPRLFFSWFSCLQRSNLQTNLIFCMCFLSAGAGDLLLFQTGSKQLHLLQHAYRPDHLDRHLSRSHACRERERERPVDMSKERRRSPARRASPSPQQRAPPPERKYALFSSVVLTPLCVNNTYFAVATCNTKPGQKSSKHSRPSFALFGFFCKWKVTFSMLLLYAFVNCVQSQGSIACHHASFSWWRMAAKSVH